MGSRQSSVEVVKGKLNVWVVVSIFLIITVIAGALISVMVINHNNRVLNSWKDLYEKEKDQNWANSTSLQESQKLIGELTIERDELKEELTKYIKDLLDEKQKNSSLFCDTNIEKYLGNNFSFSGNVAMNRDLKQFTSNLIKDEYPGENKKVVSSSWDFIWNNVDVAMHKITISGNIRYYFISSYEDPEYSLLKNSIYWINRNCFLDYRF